VSRIKEYSQIKRALLRELSHDCRASITYLADKIGCSRNTIVSNMKALDEELGIKYILQFTPKALVMSQNEFWTVRFKKKPQAGELGEIFAQDRGIRLVATASGGFDLLVNIITPSQQDYSQWAVKTLVRLSKYTPTVRSASVIANHLGFIRVPDDIIEQLDMRRKELDDIDKKILVLLNRDARRTFLSMANELGEDEGTIRYRFNKLIEARMINRFTIAITKPPTPYNMAFCMNFNWTQGFIDRYEKARQHYISSEKGLHAINKLQYLALTSGSFMMVGMGCFGSGGEARREVVEKHRKLFGQDGLKISYARITGVIKGCLPIRNVDVGEAFDPLVMPDKTKISEKN
jgi:DNA-binding Lrp family transcriptional regulator